MFTNAQSNSILWLDVTTKIQAITNWFNQALIQTHTVTPYIR